MSSQRIRCACSHCGSHNASTHKADGSPGRCRNCWQGELVPILDAAGSPLLAVPEGRRTTVRLPIGH